MGTAAAEGRLAEGYEALASGSWAVARTAFAAALAVEESPEALDGLGRAFWWLRETEQAVVNRERAYSGFRRDRELARAARIALWLSREYALVWGNEAAAGMEPERKLRARRAMALAYVEALGVDVIRPDEAVGDLPGLRGQFLRARTPPGGVRRVRKLEQGGRLARELLQARGPTTGA